MHNRGVNTDLAGVIEGIQVKGNTKHGGTYRSEAVTRHYLTWCGKGGKKPFRSAEYQKDGPTAERFIEASQGIWEEASEILRELLPGKWKNMMRWKYPEGMERLAGVWSGCAVNIGSKEKPVETAVHRDVGESPHLFSVLTAFGDYNEADVELWEVGVKVKMRPGDLLIFSDAIIHHSNTTVTGVCHSVVAFTPKNMFDWFTREYQRSRKEVDLMQRRKVKKNKLKKAAKMMAKEKQKGAGTKSKRKSRGNLKLGRRRHKKKSSL